MKISGVLVKVRGDGKAFATAAATALGPSAVTVEPILRVPPQLGDRARGFAAKPAATWLSVKAKEEDAENPWDQAHRLADPGSAFAAAGGQAVEAIEPDLVQDEWIYQEWRDKEAPAPGQGMAAGSKKEFCAFEDQDEDGGKAKGPVAGWNLTDNFSEFVKARERVGSKLQNIVIAHLDTGFDPKHVTLPAGLRKDLQRNFVSGGNPGDASDQTPPGMEFARNRGHGSGTLSLLAGNRLDGSSSNWPGFKDYVGGAPTAQIIPVRIADWVVRFTTSTMVQGFDYARAQGAHVLSMSMGGLSSEALVDAVNLAYDAGLVLVTAAGNNYAGVPSPKSIVFPARLHRVLAACGVMADGRAYAGLRFRTMQGNYGPASKMQTALGAYTPNVPWAQIDCDKVVHMDGAGTSSATPQIAAAAALWLAEHWDTVSRYSQPWMRVEAVRHALFTAAAKSTSKMNAAETLEKIGQGVLKVDAALQVSPPAEADLRKLPPAEASWSWVNMIFGGGVSLALGGRLSPQRQAMLALELTQMVQRVPQVDEAINDPDSPPDASRAAACNRYLEAALDHGNPSKPLRAVLEKLLLRTAASEKPAPLRPVIRKPKKPPTPTRRLRVYALDPSMTQRLDFVAVNRTTLCVPWDDQPETKEPLRPGPVGEYLEVVDIDPASDKVYDPVDLNDPTLLAQDGWAPSEGNPEFHQQMVYAVGMTTIGHFEKALGRKALWAPRYAAADEGGWRDAYEVPRLRIYPHALRTDNAYYSPEKKALLFGYFPAISTAEDATAPGSMVFTCLSSDIIAHEMSHALLDGLHRRFQEVSNPDVLAFHEAFADIVALLQHFTNGELVRFEIGRARGKLSSAELLGGLAQQFGEGIRRGGPLRDYLSPEIEKLNYATTEEVHERGSILVYAVYQAFLKIVERRTRDLIRLATGGTGVLPEGELHPGLVNQLTLEACKSAKHVLHICIRALDYCPAVDITFGEYLRALITADLDLVPNDRLNYRVAFMEAFRYKEILPTDVRTVSEETLAWSSLDYPNQDWVPSILKGLDFGWNRDISRSEMFALSNKNRWKLRNALEKEFAKDRDLPAQFGLLPNVPLYNEKGEVARPTKEGETTFDVFGVRPARRIAPDGDFLRTEVIVTIQQRRPIPLDGSDIKNGHFWFRGGTTLILDPEEGNEHVRYSILKNSGSETRIERQRRTALGSSLSPLRALYFGKPAGEPFAMMHADIGGADSGW